MARILLAGSFLPAVFGQVATPADVVADALAADQGELCGASGTCDATNLLQARATQLGQSAEQKLALTPELVHEVYTYGAPATHSTPFRNLATEDECFKGLRSYTEDRKGRKHSIHQVDGAAMNNFYPHAYMSTAVLHGDYDAYYAPCTGKNGLHGHPDWPQRGGSVFEEWRLHGEEKYTSRLNALKVNGTDMTEDEPFKSARNFVRMAYLSYSSFEEQVKGFAKERPGWVIVERADDKHGADLDPLILVQEQKTLDCALVFTGTNDFGEFFTSTTSYKSKYCGFQGTHVGYAGELWTISKDLFPFFKPKLAKCRKVICVGHSLGGALCELFAACANSGHTDDKDYQLLAWTPGTPEQMPPATNVDKAHQKTNHK